MINAAVNINIPQIFNVLYREVFETTPGKQICKEDSKKCKTPEDIQ